jgi:hypothetical protein
MGWRPPTGVNAKRMRFYRRNFQRTRAGRSTSAEVQRFLRVRKWAAVSFAAAAFAASVAGWWWLVIR